ncbi:DNA phosphorothioation-dependent restriction protein DptG [Neobacillus bataviensis]|uniref:DNA phosphorothioation-dependent restriction protein DptG n=1 Tax=Neobacillus bataviensis TaxID=220685 RepID=A0A561CM69_9BACI|nr:DNA phosphorothioation-dependent restriction protein DptG [Neobacillus bataviensis]TWD92194.1 DNA phosphorothioation-dependent restriction protein DptG [Neobacillus bataviensis]
MEQILHRSYLIELLNKKEKHDTGKAIDVLPFLTKRTGAIRYQFNKVLGEFVRKICELDMNEKSHKKQEFYTSSEENELSEHIANAVEFNEEDDRYDFIRFLNDYLFNEDEIRPIHPFLFNYINVDRKYKNEFGKYANFMKNILIQDNKEITNIFKDKASDNILTELILGNIYELEKTNPIKKQYQPLLGSITKLYQEDIIYLSRFKDYFLTSFPVITHFYVFMYACQLVFKFEQFTEADYNEIQPFYFGLEWESMSKRRNAADFGGFKFIKEKTENLFPHIHTMSQLSHNCFTEEQDSIPFMNYSQLYQLISERGAEFEEQALLEVKEWIRDYSNWAPNVNVKDDSKNLDEAFRVLFKCLKEGTSKGVADKFGKNLEDLGSSHFIKTRGSIGQVLNIKHDFLLLLTAVSVKDERIPLNELFNQFEKRGVAFDRYSKQEIITLFDKLNIIDKKSDSGDAQYVKPIL